MDLKEMRDKLKMLVDDSISEEKAEAISSLSKGIDDIEKDYQQVIEKAENYRKKYCDAVMNASFPGDDSVKKEEKPKDLSTIINDVISKRKK